MCLQHFNVPVVYSADATENIEDSEDEDAVFVLSDFEGKSFQQLCDSYCRIVAPPVVMWASTRAEVSCIRIMSSTEPLSPQLLYVVFCMVHCREK